MVWTESETDTTPYCPSSRLSPRASKADTGLTFKSIGSNGQFMRWGLMAVIAVSAVLVAGAAATGTAQEIRTVEGAVFPLQDVDESNLQLSIEGYDFGPEVTLVETDSGKYFLYTDTQPRAGELTATGPTAAASDAPGAIIGDEYTVRQPGRPTTLAEMETDRPVGDHISVQATYMRLPIIADPAGNTLTAQYSWGHLGNGSGDRLHFTPGRLAGTYIREKRNLSAARSNTWWTTALIRDITEGTYTSATPRYAVVGDVTVEGVVKRENPEATFVTDVTAPTTAVATRADLQDHEYVAASGAYVGTRISTQEVLLAAAGCGGASLVALPSGGCAPLTTDMIVHVGALQLPSGEIVPVVALSNHEQDRPVVPETGRMAVTGRSVDAAEIDPRLDGRGIFAFGLDRQGRLDTSGEDRQDLANAANRHRDHMREQIAADEEEWEQIVADAQATPTPTPTPTLTPTATPTPTPTPTPTATPTTTATTASPPGSETECSGVILCSLPREVAILLSASGSYVFLMSFILLVFWQGAQPLLRGEADASTTHVYYTLAGGLVSLSALSVLIYGSTGLSVCLASSLILMARYRYPKS